MDAKKNLPLLKFRIIYLITIVFLVALSILLYLQIVRLIDSYDQVNHTNKVSQSLIGIAKSISLSQSNHKNFLLTGDTNELAKRIVDFKNVNNELKLIKDLTKDNNEQIENYKILQTIISEKISHQKMVALKYSNIEIPSEFKLILIEGFRKTDLILEKIDKMLALEDKLLKQQAQKYSDQAFIAPVFTIILSLVSLLILLFSYFKLIGELKYSHQCQIKLEESHKEIESKNEALTEGGERFLKFFDKSPVAMTCEEIESNHYVYANNLFYNLFGYSKEEVVGHSSEELNLISVEENDRLIPIIMSFLEEDRPIEELKALSADKRANLLLTLKEKMLQNGYEILYTKKNGVTFFANVFLEVIDIGNIKYSLTTYQDITESKKAKEQLAEEKAFAEMIIENDPSMINVYDKNLNIIAWNKKSEEFSGFKKDEVLGKSIFDVFPKYNNEQWLDHFNSVLIEGKSFHFPQLECQYKEGYIESWLVPMLNANHQITGVLGITSDITEKVEMTKALEQKNVDLERMIEELNQTATTLQISDERFNRLVTEVNDYAFLFLSKDGSIENWNKGAERLLGFDTSDAIGKNFSMFYTEEDREKFQTHELLAKAAKEGKSNQEGWRVRKNGSKFWGSIVITALHDNNDDMIGFSKVVRDLTDKKLAEDKLKEANKQLEQKNKELQKMNKELESVNYISSHDLQEPLRQIQVFASRISESERENFSIDGKNYFDKMNNAAKRMQNLIADLLTYSRSKTEKVKFNTVDLNLIIKQIEEELAEIIDEKYAIIETEELGFANVIPFQFRQMMYNLVGNALKFSKPDIPPFIKIKNQRVKSSQVPGADPNIDIDYNQISVIDNGIGFDPQYKDRIFEVFQRLSSKDKVSGTGIGLSIVKNIVENHHGFINATGEPGKGTTMDIYLPINQIL